MLAVVKKHRSELEVYLFRCISHIPGDGSGEATSFIMRRAANLEPLVSLRDLSRATVNPEELRRYNPLLSALELDPMHTGIATNVLNWLQLCVLEDQLDRMWRDSSYSVLISRKSLFRTAFANALPLTASRRGLPLPTPPSHRLFTLPATV